MKYICPMKCEGKRTYPEGGKCPKCGMFLKKIDDDKNESCKHHDGCKH